MNDNVTVNIVCYHCNLDIDCCDAEIIVLFDEDSNDEVYTNILLHKNCKRDYIEKHNYYFCDICNKYEEKGVKDNNEYTENNADIDHVTVNNNTYHKKCYITNICENCDYSWHGPYAKYIIPGSLDNIFIRKDGELKEVHRYCCRYIREDEEE